MRRAVGAYNTVAKEVTVARCIDTVVTSISPVMAAVFVVSIKTLVYPVPDVSALQVGILVDSLPLIPQVAAGVTHGMRIFGRHYRTVTALLAHGLKPFGARILRYVHVGVPLPLGTLVVHGAGHPVLVGLLQPQVSLVEVVSVTSLVTKRPDNHRRIVLVALEHVDGTIHMRFQPFGVVAQRAALAQVVIHAVALDVGLVVHVEAVFIAQLVETAILRIVAEAHAVDVVLLHQFKVLTHQLLGHIVSGGGIVLMDVHAFQLDGLSVDKHHHIGLSVASQLLDGLDFDAAETYVVRNHFGHLTLFFHRHQYFIKVGGFRCPGQYISQLLVEAYGFLLAGRHIHGLFLRSNHLALLVQQFVGKGQAGGSIAMVAQVGFQSQNTVLIGIVQRRLDTEVAHGRLRL